METETIKCSQVLHRNYILQDKDTVAELFTIIKHCSMTTLQKQSTALLK